MRNQPIGPANPDKEMGDIFLGAKEQELHWQRQSSKLAQTMRISRAALPLFKGPLECASHWVHTTEIHIEERRD